MHDPESVSGLFRSGSHVDRLLESIRRCIGAATQCGHCRRPDPPSVFGLKTIQPPPLDKDLTKLCPQLRFCSLEQTLEQAPPLGILQTRGLFPIVVKRDKCDDSRSLGAGWVSHKGVKSVGPWRPHANFAGSLWTIGSGTSVDVEGFPLGPGTPPFPGTFKPKLKP